MTSDCPACEAGDCVFSRRVGSFDIVRCRACDLRFVPPAQIVAVDYDRLYEEGSEYDNHIRAAKRLQRGVLGRQLRVRQAALCEIERLKPDSLLEVGCGVGEFLAHIERMGIRTWGLDPSRNAIELAGQHLQAELHHGILDDRVFPDLEVDVICAWEVIEHVSDVCGFLGEILRRLRPGGMLFFSTPNYGSTWMWRDIEYDPRGRPPVHVTFWTQPSLERFLKQHGLVDVTVRRMSPPISPAKRSGPPGWWRLVYLDATLRPSQRRTLFARARMPRQPTLGVE